MTTRAVNGCQLLSFLLVNSCSLLGICKMVTQIGRPRNWWSQKKNVAFFWVVSAFLFYFLFQMALQNSTHDDSPSSTSSGALMSNSEKRSILYNKMARDLDEHGPMFLKHGETSQSLSLSDIFTLKDGTVTPVLKAAIPPVRANVLHLSEKYSIPIAEVVKNVFNPYFDKVIWFQNSSLYHFSMFHASHHITPVPATEDEIEIEAAAVRAVSEHICPLKIVLDRVVLTSTGVLLGCWQVLSGTDPLTIRAKLRDALPHAPNKQLYDPVILHTSFARLLGHPKASNTKLDQISDELLLFHELVDSLNDKIKGLEATVSELWYVEEFDVLALALDGRTKVRKFRLGCTQG